MIYLYMLIVTVMTFFAVFLCVSFQIASTSIVSRLQSSNWQYSWHNEAEVPIFRVYICLVITVRAVLTM